MVIKITQQWAFTLIEMIIVIALLGILAAVAIPKLSDLSPHAKQSAVDSIAGALTAASANNYGKRKAKSTAGSAITNCTNLGGLLAGGLPSDYTIDAMAISNNAKVSCIVKRVDDNAIQATFVGIGTT